MSQTNINSNENPEFRKKMYDLGVAIDDYRQFFWIGILLFWLIVPAIILFVKYVKYLIALNDVNRVSGDQNLQNGFTYLLISMIISLATSGATAGNRGFGFIGIIGFVLTILGYVALSNWAQTLATQRNSPNMHQLSKAFDDLKVANILLIILIGVFMIPGALKQASQAIFSEFGNSQPPTFQKVSPQEPSYQKLNVNEPTYATTPTNAANNLNTDSVGFCPYCGGKLSSPNSKFCSNCGQNL